ncbi:MAG: hypothetical protein J5971_06075 [Prevotella sp.]|nr:hypothetical protein [Prevotella sp.]
MQRSTITNRRRSGRPVVSRLKSSTIFGILIADACFVALAAGVFYYFRDTLTGLAGYKSVLGVLWRGVIFCFILGSLLMINVLHKFWLLKVVVQGDLVRVRRYTLPVRSSFFVVENDFDGYYKVDEVKTESGRTTITKALWIVKKDKVQLRLQVDAFENTYDVVGAMGIDCLGQLRIPHTDVVGYETGSKRLTGVV